MTRLIKWTIGSLFVLFISLNAYAENLKAVYELALQNDPTIRAAWNARMATRQAFPQAVARLLPTLSASASTTSEDTSGVDSFNTHEYGVSLSQPVYNHEFWVQLHQANKQVKQAEVIYAAAEEDLIFRVTERYFAVLSAEDLLSFAKSQRKAFKKQLDQTQERFKVGLIAITDVHEAQFRYDNAVAQELSAENELHDQYERLQEITGEGLGKLATLKKLPLLKPKPANINTWVEAAKSNNFNLLAAKYGVDIAKDDMYRQRAGHFPIFDVTGNVTKAKGARPVSDETTSKFISLGVTLPLIESGAVISRTKEACYRYQQEKRNYQRSFRETISQARQAYRGLITQISQVKALNQAVTSSRSALKATTAAYDVGTRTIVDVLDAQSDLFNAERNYSQSRYDYILEKFRLQQAAARLTPMDIHEINKLLHK